MRSLRKHGMVLRLHLSHLQADYIAFFSPSNTLKWEHAHLMFLQCENQTGVRWSSTESILIGL